jgi:hypothetical protein
MNLIDNLELKKKKLKLFKDIPDLTSERFVLVLTSDEKQQIVDIVKEFVDLELTYEQIEKHADKIITLYNMRRRESFLISSIK